MGLVGFLTGMGTGMAIGVGLMYMLDPQAGEERRTQIGKQVTRRTKTAREETTQLADDAQQRAEDLTKTAREETTRFADQAQQRANDLAAAAQP
jgi:gas vesicle protein